MTDLKKSNFRAGTTPTEPTAEEKETLRQGCKSAAEKIDGKAGLSEIEAKIIDLTVQGHSIGKSFPKPVVQDEYLQVYQGEINNFLFSLAREVQSAQKSGAEIEFWLSKLRNPKLYSPLARDKDKTKNQYILDYVMQEMNELEKLAPEVSGLSERIRTVALPNPDGKMTSLASYFNRPGQKLVIIAIWGTWCPPCVKEIPFLNEVHNNHPEYTIVGIANESMESLKKGLPSLEVKPEYSLLVDPENSAKTKLLRKTNKVPYLMFFTPDGNLLKDHTGFKNPEDDSNPILNEINEIITSTQPCNP